MFKTKHILLMTLALGLVCTAAAAPRDSISAKTDTTYMPKNYFGINLGGGVNTFLIKSKDGKTSISGGGLFQMNYQYFFHKNVGIGIGVGLSSLQSKGHWTYTEETPNQIDSENGWEYTLISGFDDLEETQDLLQVDIPLQLVFRAHLAPKCNMRIGVGVNLALPVWSQYRTTDGNFTTKGYYPRTNITYESTNGQDLSNHGFVTTKANEKGSWTYRSFNAGISSDFGFDIAVSPQTDLYLGLYAQNGFENYCSANDGPMVEISGMQYQYHGVFNSIQLTHAHPLEAGVKIGVFFHEKPKKKIDTSALDRLIAQATLMGNNSLCGIALTQASDANKKSVRLRGSASLAGGLATTDVCAAYLSTAQSFSASAGEYAKGNISQSARDSISPYQDELAAALREAEAAAARGDIDAVAAATERAYAAADAIEKICRNAAPGEEPEVQVVEEPEPEPEPEPEVIIPEPVQEVVLDTVNGRAYYKFNSTVPIYEGSALTALEDMAKAMQEDSSIRLLIVGHTDNRGSEAVNYRYGLQRAKNLRDKLISLGAPADQIDVESHGAKEPKYSNNTEEGRNKNRRAEIHVIRNTNK